LKRFLINETAMQSSFEIVLVSNYREQRNER